MVIVRSYNVLFLNFDSLNFVFSIIYFIILSSDEFAIAIDNDGFSLIFSIAFLKVE